MTETIHRRSDGAIDLDFYRAGATAQRRQAMRDSRSLKIAAAGMLVMAGAVGFAIVIPSTPSPGDRIAAAFSSTSPLAR